MCVCVHVRRLDKQLDRHGVCVSMPLCVCVSVCVCRLEELLNRHGTEFECSSLSQVHQYLISYASSRSKMGGNISSVPSTVAEFLSGNSHSESVSL